LSQPIPTAIFGLPVGFFAFFGLSISTLGFAVISPSAKQPAGIAAIGLASKTAPADAKQIITPPTLNHTQEQGGYLSGLANHRNMD